MKITSFTVGPFAENTYLLTAGNDALLIDPGFHQDHEFEAFQTALRQSEANLKAVLLTHAHVDHILGLQKVKENLDIPVYLHDADLYLWEHFAPQAKMFGFRVEPLSFPPEVLPAEKNWSIGNFTFDVRYTPGHAPDHVSLYSKDHQLVIAGDALFREGIGRTDLYKGSMQQLAQSIREKLYVLPDETVVYPGHGPKTTIGHEKKNNPFVKMQ